MGTTADKLQTIIDSKAAIKAAIEAKGVAVGDAPLTQYASKIEEIQQGGGDTDGMNGFLSVESKTVPKSATQTTNITYNKNCGILDENYKKWDTLAWHQRWVDNGYSAAGLSKPIGIWMKAFGLDLVYLWPLISNVSYSDVTGTITPNNNVHGVWCYNVDFFIIATTDKTVWPANQSGMIAHGTAGKYKSATWRAVNNGDGIDLKCDNTNEVFFIPNRATTGKPPYREDISLNDDYLEMFFKECEFLRALFAVCSGISTTQPNGTKTTVEILNASGQQAAVGEDMYFWIGGTNTGLLAKYNLNSRPSRTANVTNGSLSQTIADAIYNKQIAAGINMNDTGVNSETKHVLYEGAKGAEAVAVDGYWYIKTPFISQPHGSTFNSSNNMADAPAAYLCKNKNVMLQTIRELIPYYINLSTHITSIVNLLSNIESVSATLASQGCWSYNPQNPSYFWSLNMSTGQANFSPVNSKLSIISTTLPTQQFTT